MSNQSYKITVEGQGPIASVICLLELTKGVTMHKKSDKKWEGEIKDLDIYENLDYDIIVSAAGKVTFSYTIENTITKNKVLEGEDHTNGKVSNAAKVRGNCKPE